MRPPHLAIVILACATLGPTRARADRPTTTSTRPAPSIALAPAVEDGKKVIHALVTLDGKPLRDQKVQMQVRRTFGLLPVGEDTTDDEGTAAVPFPDKLPGNERGEFEVVATILGPADYAGASAAQVIPGGVPVIPPASPAFPRALWASRAPSPLYITILVLIGGVWLTYARVVALILAIRKGGRS